MNLQIIFRYRTYAVIALAFTAVAVPHHGRAADPNIVIMLVDDMGYGDPGCHNAQSKIPTPHIDGLARDGTRLTDAHAPGPLCHARNDGPKRRDMQCTKDTKRRDMQCTKNINNGTHKRQDM